MQEESVGKACRGRFRPGPEFGERRRMHSQLCKRIARDEALRAVELEDMRDALEEIAGMLRLQY